MTTTQRLIATRDGRELRVCEAGQPDGVPVLVHRGTPQSFSLYHPWVEDAQSKGIRLITYERPGYGKSTPQPGRTAASAADDVATIARELGLKRLLVWGVSGGGPHALACAALLPELVVAAAALASPAPYPAEGLDYFTGMGESNVGEMLAAIKGRRACAQFVETEAVELLHATPKTVAQTFRSLLCRADKDVFTTDFADFVIHTIRDGIAERRDGWIDDEMAFVTPWGFDPGKIQVPVLVMHGAQDRMVPMSHGKWLADKIPTAEARLLPDDGHLTLHLRRVPEVHAWLLSKM